MIYRHSMSCGGVPQGSVLSRFRQQPSLWDKCLPPWPSPIGPKFCCTFDPQNLQIRSYLGCNTTWPSSSTPSRATAWLAMHSPTPWLTFQQGTTFGRRPRFSSWSLDIGKNDPVEEVSPSLHHSCGTYFLPTSDSPTMNINFSGRDLKLIMGPFNYYVTL